MRIRIKPFEPFITELEKQEHVKLEKQFRKQNIDVFWQIQGRVENKFIDDFEIQEKRKKANDEKKLRTSIVKTAFRDYKLIDRDFGKMASRINMVKKRYIQELSRK